jgi:hypothetical protein
MSWSRRPAWFRVQDARALYKAIIQLNKAVVGGPLGKAKL